MPKGGATTIGCHLRLAYPLEREHLNAFLHLDGPRLIASESISHKTWEEALAQLAVVGDVYIESSGLQVWQFLEWLLPQVKSSADRVIYAMPHGLFRLRQDPDGTIRTGDRIDVQALWRARLRD